MKKNCSVLFADLCSVLCVGGAFALFWEHATGELNELFHMLTGKALLTRNLLIQIAVIGGVILLCLGAALLLNHTLCRKQRRGADILIAVLTSLPFLLFLILCANQTLRRDDYWEIAEAWKYGFPGVFFYDMETYNGRYLSWGLKALYNFLDPVPFIDSFLFINLLILFAGSSLLADSLLGLQSAGGTDPSPRRLRALQLGECFTVGSVLLSSNSWEVWFWGGGGMIYGISISMCVLSAALALRICLNPALHSGQLILAALCCFLACGGSELGTASLGAFLFFLLTGCRIHRKVWDRRLLCLLGVVVLCCAGILLLTGSVSLAEEHASYQGSESLLRDAMQRLPSQIRWMFTALWGYTFVRWRWWLPLLGIFFLFGTQLTYTARQRRNFCVTALLLMLTAHCVIMINALLSYMPPRVVTFGICWFLGAGALFMVSLGSLLSKRLAGPADRSLLLLGAVLLALETGIFYCGSIDTVRMTREAWFLRDAELRPLMGSQEEIVTCGIPCPGSFQDDILEDPLNDYNDAAAQYYRVPRIRAEGVCPPFIR